jgi:hypothetical protein
MAQQMFSDEYSEYISECSNWIAALGIDGNIDFVKLKCKLSHNSEPTDPGQTCESNCLTRAEYCISIVEPKQIQ